MGITISGLETAAVKVGKAIAQHAAKEWLRRRRNAKERTSTLAELAAAELASPIQRGKLDAALDGIGYRAAEQLSPLLAAEFGGLPDNEIAAAVDAAMDALRETDLSDEAIFAVDADPELLARDIRSRLPNQPRRAGLSEGATALYERVLDQGCRYLIQVIIQLSAFQPRALAEILDRLSTMADQLTDVFRHTAQTRLDAPRGTVHDDEFRAEYLRIMADTLDRLDLLGLGTRHRHRLALSVAYLSLSVSEQDGQGRRSRYRPDRLAEHWFGQSRDRDRTSTARVETAIGSARRALIIGGAGSGKTTLLDWLAVTAARNGFTAALAERNDCVPFPIRLRRYVGSALPRPERFLEDTASWLVGIMPEGWVHRQLRSGNALVLVDGVDEVPASDRRAIRDWLDELVTVYPDTRVVVTAREGAVEDLPLAGKGFVSMTLQPMGPLDVRLFLDRWHKAAENAEWLPCEPGELPAVQRRLLGQLDARPDLRELARIPLLCGMLCALNLARGAELPRNRMELYRVALTMLVEARDAERNIPALLDATEKMVLLRDLAWRLTTAGQTELSRAKALTYVGLKLRSMPSVDLEPEAALDHLLVRTGVLREPVHGRIDFVHRTFQEYLAASEATEGEHIATLVNNAHLDTWRETIVMACGHAKRSQASELLTEILDLADSKPRRARHLRLLAASCLETVTDLEPDVRDRVEEVIKTRLVPPRSARETGSLAAAGHRVLRYLPDSLDGLSEAAAVATVRAAALTRAADAIPLLARYARHQNGSVQYEIMDAWQYFDPQRYAEEVIAGMALVHTWLVVRTRRLLPFVRLLNNFTRLSVEFSSTEVVDSLGFLSDLSNVAMILLYCSGSIDLGPLTEHEDLANIVLYDADRYLNARSLRSLTKLKTLYLLGEGRWRSISFLRDLSSLDFLGLDCLTKVTDYTSLGALNELKVLRLYDCASLDSLEPIRHLSELRNLVLNGCATRDLGIGLADAFPLLKELNIDDASVSDLTPLATLPLETLSVAGCPVHDLSPLSTVNTLRRLRLSEDREYHGLDRLPSRVRVDYI